MNKRVVTILITIAGLAVVVSGFLAWQNNNKQQAENNKQQERQANEQEKNNQERETKVEELKAENIDTSNWKEYCNKEYGFCVKYPEDKYVINEESGMIHFYYQDGTAPPGSQKRNYININISKEKNPQGVGNLYELFEYDKNNAGVNVSRIKKETKLERLGNTQFIITRFYNNEIFYSILFIVAGKENHYYRISFGGYWNVISDNDYVMIVNMMKSFKRI